MKKSKFLIYIFLVLALVVAADIIVTAIVEYSMKGEYNQKIHDTVDSDHQMVIIGASRASHHYESKILEDSLGLSVYNFGIDGRNIFVHYAVLKSLLHNARQKPEYVILDLCTVDIYDNPGFNKERLNILYPYYKDTVISSVLEDLIDKKEWTIIKNSGLVRHNSSLLQYAQHLIKGNEQTENGYIPLEGKWDKPLETLNPSPNKIDPDKLRYLQYFIEECKANDIKLLLTVSPYFGFSKDKRWVEEIEKIAVKNNITFLYHENDELFLRNPQLFNEPAHLNSQGAAEFTKIIIEDLRNIRFISE